MPLGESILGGSKAPFFNDATASEAGTADGEGGSVCGTVGMGTGGRGGDTGTYRSGGRSGYTKDGDRSGSRDLTCHLRAVFGDRTGAFIGVDFVGTSKDADADWCCC